MPVTNLACFECALIPVVASFFPWDWPALRSQVAVGWGWVKQCIGKLGKENL